MSPTVSNHRWCDGRSISGGPGILAQPELKGYTLPGDINLDSFGSAGGLPDLSVTLPEENTLLEEPVQEEHEDDPQVPDWVYLLTDAQIDEYFGIQPDADFQEWNRILPQADGGVEDLVSTEHGGDLPVLNPTLPPPNAELEDLNPIRQEDELPESNMTLPEPATLPQPRLTSVKKRKRDSPPAQEEEDEESDEEASDEDLPAKKYPKRGVRSAQKDWTKPEMDLAADIMARAVQRRDALGLKHSEKMYGDAAEELTDLGYPRTKSSFKNYWCRTGRHESGIDEKQHARTGRLVTSARKSTKKSKPKMESTSKSKTKAPKTKAPKTKVPKTKAPKTEASKTKLSKLPKLKRR